VEIEQRIDALTHSVDKRLSVTVTAEVFQDSITGLQSRQDAQEVHFRLLKDAKKVQDEKIESSHYAINACHQEINSIQAPNWSKSRLSPTAIVEAMASSASLADPFSRRLAMFYDEIHRQRFDSIVQRIGAIEAKVRSLLDRIAREEVRLDEFKLITSSALHKTLVWLQGVTIGTNRVPGR